jgi:hypothetical protein
MTLIVAILCKDGAVIAADSMLSTSSQHIGKKIHLLPKGHLFAFAGELGLADRFRINLEFLLNSGVDVDLNPHALGHGINIRQHLINGFTPNELNVTNLNSACTVVAYDHKSSPQVCVFAPAFHPRMLDSSHFYACLGSGEQYAGPFIAFLGRIFCQGGLPTVREGVFLATWVLDHTIRTNVGGVNGPIRVATLSYSNGSASTRELTAEELDDTIQAIEDATEQLRVWRDRIGGNVPPDPETPPVPEPLPLTTST